ncbi:MAG TPA: response regulator [Nocardioides sp.]|nr:response regulator [Nocardioides sp.]
MDEIRLKNAAILVVDDETLLRKRIAAYLEKLGADVTQVGNLAEARRAADAVPFDFVLLDVHLPDMTGIEVLRTLRAAGNQVGVVMVTAAREADTVRAAAAGGAAHYIVKPFEFDDLRVRLEAWRDAQDALTAETPAQDDIDAVFTPVVAGPPKSLPKGLSVPTADSVLEVLSSGVEVSASECAEQVGISRVSARRYLEHFVETGRAVVRLQYGGGRPERRYRGSSG